MKHKKAVEVSQILYFMKTDKLLGDTSSAIAIQQEESWTFVYPL